MKVDCADFCGLPNQNTQLLLTINRVNHRKWIEQRLNTIPFYTYKSMCKINSLFLTDSVVFQSWNDNPFCTTAVLFCFLFIDFIKIQHMKGSFIILFDLNYSLMAWFITNKIVLFYIKTILNAKLMKIN